MRLHLLVRAPDWLTGERGRGVPETMRWRPFATFWQTAIDAAARADAPSRGPGPHRRGAAACPSHPWCRVAVPARGVTVAVELLVLAVALPRAVG